MTSRKFCGREYPSSKRGVQTFTLFKVSIACIHVFGIFHFLMLALLRRLSFLTTFYGLYFSHHYTYNKLQSFTCWTSVGSFICIEKLSPLPGFEPRTSRVPSRCTTNWAIQAWIGIHVTVLPLYHLYTVYTIRFPDVRSWPVRQIDRLW